MKNSSDLAFALPTDLVAAEVRRRKQPLQERSRATVDAILEATLQVLLDQGAARMNTTRIAERAGVSVGTLYQYFPDKKSLLMAIKAQYIERVMGGIHDLIVGQIGQPLAPAFTAIVTGLLRLKTDNLRFTLAIRAAGDWPLADQAMKSATVQLCEATEALLIAAEPTLTDARLKATVLVSALDGAITAAVATSPALLQEPAFRQALLALALGFARELSARKGAPLLDSPVLEVPSGA